MLKKWLENRAGDEKRRSFFMGAKLFAHWMESEGCLTHKKYPHRSYFISPISICTLPVLCYINFFMIERLPFFRCF